MVLQCQNNVGEVAGGCGDDCLPSCGVILGPDTHVLIQVVGTQDGGISGEVFKVVHGDSNKKVQHLLGPPQGAKTGLGRARYIQTRIHRGPEGEKEGDKMGKGSQTKRWGGGGGYRKDTCSQWEPRDREMEKWRWKRETEINMETEKDTKTKSDGQRQRVGEREGEAM